MAESQVLGGIASPRGQAKDSEVSCCLHPISYTPQAGEVMHGGPPSGTCGGGIDAYLLPTPHPAR